MIIYRFYFLFFRVTDKNFFVDPNDPKDVTEIWAGALQHEGDESGGQRQKAEKVYLYIPEGQR